MTNASQLEKLQHFHETHPFDPIGRPPPEFIDFLGLGDWGWASEVAEGVIHWVQTIGVEAAVDAVLGAAQRQYGQRMYRDKAIQDLDVEMQRFQRGDGMYDTLPSCPAVISWTGSEVDDDGDFDDFDDDL